MVNKNNDKQNDPKKPIIKRQKISEDCKGKTENESNLELTEKKISSRKVLFIEIDEEITTICDRMRKLPHKKIYIVVPQRALLFQSIVNLKILKRKAYDLEKNVFIITNDTCGVHMSQQVGLSVYNRIEGEGVNSSTEIESNNHLRIRPIEASINTVKEGAPSRLKSKKITIGQLVKSIKKRRVKIVSEKLKINGPIKIKKAQKKQKKTKESKLVLVAPNRHAVITLVIVSVLLLLTITYIALPNATVILTAKSNQVEKFVNITLADSIRHRVELEGRPTNMIASYPVEVKISKRITHYANGKEFKGENASGTITVINTSNKDWSLIPRTRFQTSDGIVFRSQSFVSVPKAHGDQPGALDVQVVADELDAYDQVVGEKGNIGPTRFFLPGLKASNQKKLYAESKSQMTGGKTNVIKHILAEDIDAAKEKLERTLKGEAEIILKNEIDKQNREKKLGLTLLKGKSAITFSNLTIDVPQNLEGQKLDEFELFGEVQAKGLAYNENEFLNILKTELNAKKNPQKRLVRVNTDAISIKIFDVEEDNKKVRVTAGIKGVEEFDIQPGRENGTRLIDKIKSHVLGKKIDESEQFIQNLPEINKVEIDSWPFWAPTMPNVPENIKIVIKRAE